MALIAVDCGGTSVAFGRGERPEEVRASGRVASPRRAEALPALVAEAVATLAGPDVRAIGVGCAGLVDHRRGTLVWSPHAGGEHVPLGPALTAATGLPVVVDNDANLAALAEARLGAGRGYRMVLMVTLGTGIGGGLVVEGRVERGRDFLGEVGHMVVDPAGPVCACGRRGCWETMASGSRLDRAAREEAAADPAGAVAREACGSTPGGEHLSAAARAGDPGAMRALAATGAWLGRGLANLVAVLDPDVIVVGGGAAGAGELLLGPARETLAAEVEAAGYRAPTPLVAARFGRDAGLVGAALAAEEATC